MDVKESNEYKIPKNDHTKIIILLSLLVQVIKLTNAHKENDTEITKSILPNKDLPLL